jgi:hypothetical protein
MIKKILFLLLCLTTTSFIFFPHLVYSSEPSYGGYFETPSSSELLPDYPFALEGCKNTIDGGEIFETNYIDMTSGGGYVMVGAAELDDYYDAAYIGKWDWRGKKEWESFHTEPEGSDSARVIQQIGDGYIVLGTTFSEDFRRGYDLLLYKIDSRGNEQWSKIFDAGFNTTEEPVSLKETKDGGFIILGWVENLPPQPPSVLQRDLLLIKTDKNGNIGWLKIIGGAQYDDVGYSIEQTFDDGFIVVGVKYLNQDRYGDGESRVFLLKLDKRGDKQWSKTFGGTNIAEGKALHPESAYAVKETADGYILAGNTVSFGSGGSDVYLIKTDSDGNEEWSYTYGGPNDEQGQNVIITRGGYIVMAFSYKLDEIYGSTNKATYIFRIDKNGKLEWGIDQGIPGFDFEYMPGLFRQIGDFDYVWAQREVDTVCPIIVGMKIQGDIVTEPTPPGESQFRVKDLVINPDTINQGEIVQISVKVENLGTVKGETTVSLKVNGQVLVTEDVSLDPGDSRTLSWKTTSGWSVGSYNIEVEGLAGSFTILESGTSIPEGYSLSLSASPSSFSIGGSTELTGYLTPEIGYTNITLFYRYQGGSWYVLDQVETWEDGSYYSYWTPGDSGEYDVIAMFEPDPALDPIYSSTVTIYVEEDRCLIATAAYGSEMNEKVQFLRLFREKVILSSMAGSQFMEAFNTFYYSFSPYVAQKISNNPILKTVTQVILYPIISILQISSTAHQLFKLNIEAGVIITGLIASTLIGVIYLTPVTWALLIWGRRIGRFGRISVIRTMEKLFLFILFSLAIMVIGIFYSFPSLLTVSSSAYVILNIIFSSITISLFMIYYLIPYIKNWLKLYPNYL